MNEWNTRDCNIFVLNVDSVVIGRRAVGVWKMGADTTRDTKEPQTRSEKGLTFREKRISVLFYYHKGEGVSSEARGGTSPWDGLGVNRSRHSCGGSMSDESFLFSFGFQHYHTFFKVTYKAFVTGSGALKLSQERVRTIRLSRQGHRHFLTLPPTRERSDLPS